MNVASGVGLRVRPAAPSRAHSWSSRPRPRPAALWLLNLPLACRMPSLRCSQHLTSLVFPLRFVPAGLDLPRVPCVVLLCGHFFRRRGHNECRTASWRPPTHPGGVSGLRRRSGFVLFGAEHSSLDRSARTCSSWRGGGAQPCPGAAGRFEFQVWVSASGPVMHLQVP